MNAQERSEVLTSDTMDSKLFDVILEFIYAGHAIVDQEQICLHFMYNGHVITHFISSLYYRKSCSDQVKETFLCKIQMYFIRKDINIMLVIAEITA